jgi:hypothetical protein
MKLCQYLCRFLSKIEPHEAWENRLSMGKSHAHIYEGVNGVNIRFFVDFCFGWFFSSSVHQFSPYPDVSFLGLPPSMYAIFRESSSGVCSAWRSPRNFPLTFA